MSCVYKLRFIVVFINVIIISNNNNGNLYSVGIRHMVAHIKHHAKTVLLTLVKQHFRLKIIIK